MLTHIQHNGPLQRSELLRRYARDDEATLRAVILDLADSGLVRIEGSDDATRLVAVEAVQPDMDPRTLDAMLLVAP